MVPNKIIIRLEGADQIQIIKTIENETQTPNHDIESAVLIPFGLDGFQMNLRQEYRAKNVITGIANYRSLSRIEVEITDGQKTITFRFVKQSPLRSPKQS